jgi:hypothetical protein
MKDNVTPEEAVWKALLELEPKLVQMEEPDVPRLTAKFLDELRLSGFALVRMAELERLQGRKSDEAKSDLTVQPQEHSVKVDAKKEKVTRRLRRPVDSEANT